MRRWVGFGVPCGLRLSRVSAAVGLALASFCVLGARTADAALTPGVPGFYSAGSIPIGTGTSIESMALSPDGGMLYVGDGSNLWVDAADTSTGQVVARIPTGEDQPPAAMAVSPDGKTLYVGIWGYNEIDVVNAATDAIAEVFNSVGGDTDALAVSPDGSVLYVADAQNDDIDVLDAQTGTRLATISVGAVPNALPNSMQLSADGQTLYVETAFGSILRIDTVTDTVINTTTEPGFQPVSLALSPDGKTLFAAGINGLLIVNAQTDEIRALVDTGDTFNSLAASPDGSTLYATLRWPSNQLLALDPATGGQIASPATPAGGLLAIGPSGGPIYVGAVINGSVGVAAYGMGEVSVPIIALPGNATTPAVGETLTAQPGAWESYTPLRYQWYSNGTPIQGATSQSFTPNSAQVGDAITVDVTGAPGSEMSAAVRMPALVNPTITATVSSSSAISSTRWWRKPVTVRFACTDGSAPLTDVCPAAVTLKTSGKGQSVTRTIGALDGGSATVTEPGINIDLTSPTVRIAGIVPGHVYPHIPKAARCKAADTISGISSCRLSHTTVRTRSAETITYTATATSRAGAVSKTRIKIRIGRSD